MRVIAGTYRSRPLLAPPGMDTRPTTDRLRETLFNVLTQGARDFIAGQSFLDLYAGSGAVGIEALSRGARRVAFVEKAASAIAILRQNLNSLAIDGRASIEKKPVEKVLRAFLGDVMTPQFAAIFLDPPYEAADEYESTLGLLGAEGEAILSPGGLVVAEHRKKRLLALAFGKLRLARTLTQGDAALSFYHLADQSPWRPASADSDPETSAISGDSS